MAPTFRFDFDKLNFGIVSFGFLTSKTLTLTNTAEVPFSYSLRIPGDGRFLQKEFDIIPSSGTLLPGCSQRIQVDFIPINVKVYDLCLMVDLDNVGENLDSVPIQARSGVPTVHFEPAETLDFGEIFVRYPFHQTFVLHNVSSLPAKFEILPQAGTQPHAPTHPYAHFFFFFFSFSLVCVCVCVCVCQEETTLHLGEVDVDQTEGSIPPATSHVLTMTLTAQRTGGIRVPLHLRVLGHNMPQTVSLTATAIGPRLAVEPSTLDWGKVSESNGPLINKDISLSLCLSLSSPLSLCPSVPLFPSFSLSLSLSVSLSVCLSVSLPLQVSCLQPMSKQVTLSNASYIDAEVRCILKRKESLWSVAPRTLTMPPNTTAQLTLTVVCDETSRETDELLVLVKEGTDLSVTLKAQVRIQTHGQKE